MTRRRAGRYSPAVQAKLELPAGAVTVYYVPDAGMGTTTDLGRAQSWALQVSRRRDGAEVPVLVREVTTTAWRVAQHCYGAAAELEDVTG